MFILVHQTARDRAKAAIDAAPEGFVVRIDEPTRNLEQSARFHAICSDIVRSQAVFMGRQRTAEEWKLLMISAHSAATKRGTEIVAGLEGEWLNLRERTSHMSKARMSSLIEYATAWCATNGIRLND